MNYLIAKYLLLSFPSKRTASLFHCKQQMCRMNILLVHFHLQMLSQLSHTRANKVDID